MGIAVCGLVKHPGRAQHRARVGLVARRVAKQSRLELVGAEEPFHARIGVHQEGAHEVPVARLVEDEDPPSERGEAETIETHPTLVAGGQPSGVSGEEQEIRIAARLVAPVAWMRAAAGAGEIGDAERVAARKRRSDLARHPFDRADQRGGSVAGALPRPKAAIAVALVGERDRFEEVSAVGRSHRDRLTCREGLGHARADREDCQCREKPNHSRCMIAHGSA